MHVVKVVALSFAYPGAGGNVRGDDAVKGLTSSTKSGSASTTLRSNQKPFALTFRISFRFGKGPAVAALLSAASETEIESTLWGIVLGWVGGGEGQGREDDWTCLTGLTEWSGA